MRLSGSIAFDIESSYGHVLPRDFSQRSSPWFSWNPLLMLVERRDAGTQPPFFDFELFFLTDRRDFCQDATEENDQTARNETRWYHLRPACAGFLRNISRVGGAAGLLQERPKTMKEN